MTFWGEQLDAGKSDPKRKFRFKVEIGSLGGGVIWYAKTTNKPEMTISNDTSHKFMGHTFKFPGSVTWNDIEMTLVDPIDEKASSKLLQIVEAAGYVFPRENYEKETVGTRALETISKGKSAEALTSVVIYQLDSDGNAVEAWQLHNPFINKVGFGELSYEDDGLSEISLGITYDWASYSENGSFVVGEGIFDRADLPTDPSVT